MPRDPILPGMFLADELAALEMTPTALRLSQWLGTSAEMWMNLQKRYEL